MAAALGSLEEGSCPLPLGCGFLTSSPSQLLGAEDVLTQQPSQSSSSRAVCPGGQGHAAVEDRGPWLALPAPRAGASELPGSLSPGQDSGTRSDMCARSGTGTLGPQCLQETCRLPIATGPDKPCSLSLS